MNTHLWTPPTAQISVKFHQENLCEHQPRSFAAQPSPSCSCTIALVRILNFFSNFFFPLQLNYKEANLRCLSEGSTRCGNTNCIKKTHTHTVAISKSSQNMSVKGHSRFAPSWWCVRCNQWPVWVLQHSNSNQAQWTRSFFLYWVIHFSTVIESNHWGLTARFAQLYLW